MDDEWDEGEDYTISRKLMPADAVVLAFGLARRLTEAVLTTLTDAEALVAFHANHLIDRAAFHEEAALEIETLISGEQED